MTEHPATDCDGARKQQKPPRGQKKRRRGRRWEREWFFCVKSRLRLSDWRPYVVSTTPRSRDATEGDAKWASAEEEEEEEELLGRYRVSWCQGSVGMLPVERKTAP